jgi:hypothetical protein
VVICAEEDESSLDLDSFMQKDASSGGVRESGDRSEKTRRRLWEAIPQAYRTGHCYTDFGKLTTRRFPKSNTQRSAKKQEKPLILSAGTTHCDNV